MKNRIRLGLLILLIMTALSAGAFAADVFRYADKSVTLFEGETFQPALTREGAAAEGEITYSSSNGTIAAVSGDGTITAMDKGKTTIHARVKKGNNTLKTQITVNVLRRVTAVTLNTSNMQVYAPEDSTVFDLLRQETENPVILLAAGKSINLKATVTPSDASSKKTRFSSSDEGVLQVGASSAKAVQAGECDLTVSSVQNPEISRTWHVLVVQPVKKLTVYSSYGKTINAGESIDLTVEYSPVSASLQAVNWSSRKPEVATVDENGRVTGIKRGTAIITAEAADGSGASAGITITVARKPTEIVLKETELFLATNQNGFIHPTVLPQDANEKGVTYASTDTTVATVSPGGQVHGVRRGECEIIVSAKGDPNVTASIPVQVVQKVTAIEFTTRPTLPVRTSEQLQWSVLPADATIKDVTFTSSNKNVATVDQNGVVTALSRGTSVITATATDGSRRKGTVRVTVTQPVEGMYIQYSLYHVQLDGTRNVKAIISPSNANNLNVHFNTEDSYVATVTDKRNIGRVYGRHVGTTVLTGTTEDGGYTASTVIRVDDYNRAVVVDDVYLEDQKVRIVLRNRSDFTVERVNFLVETFDVNGDPLVCNTDGKSNFFEGYYNLALNPEERSEHYRFTFVDWVEPIEKIATVRVTLLSWRDSENYTYTIPENERPEQSYRRFIP